MITSERYTFGDLVSDKIAKFGGSWAAIITCSAIIAVWIVINTWVLPVPVDPYPYILLNLFLSCVAALQAPFIIMANNRQEIKDRICMEEDLAVDKMAEKELRQVIRKLNKLQKDIDSLKKTL
jgi:uncharacterized membrane protein